jgi:uncharacterized membrane protein (UPF0127 family)
MLPCTLFCANIPVVLEHAITPQERMQGLSNRKELAPDSGMLFHFDGKAPVTIWMYHTLMDLSLAFLDSSGVIREIHELQAFPEIEDSAFFAKRSITSGFHASYALEMKAHWFSSHGVRPGDQLVLEGKGFISTRE